MYFFVSYSSQDRRSAEILANRIKSRGARVWIDYEQVKPGDPVLSRIAEGLAKADALLFLVSQHSAVSPWCRKEYEVLLRREVLSGDTSVIAIRLDESELPTILSDKRFLWFSELDDVLEELVDHGGSAPLLKDERPKESLSLAVPPGLLEGLAVLLVLDQFPIGVWGKSLAVLGDAYGHAEDPGSITVSVWAANALRDLCPVGQLEEIERFSRYLLQRRNPGTGAVGMLRSVGSPFAETSLVIENRRHTAYAALYLYRHCNSLDLALQSLRYVMQSRTARGAWVAVGDSVDGKADPLTTAYVLGALRSFEREGLLGSVSIADRDLFLARYWKAGLLWLYESLLENDGWWRYNDVRRTYAYTTDILLSLPDFGLQDPDYEVAHERLMTRLFELWHRHGAGIPSGPDMKAANLETTAQFVSVLAKCSARYPDMNREAQLLFLEKCEGILIYGDTDASGWALTISYGCGSFEGKDLDGFSMR